MGKIITCLQEAHHLPQVHLLPWKLLGKINRKRHPELQIHVYLNPNLIYSGYKGMLLIWKCDALAQSLFHSLWPPTKLICDNQEWIYWREDGGVAPHTPCILHAIWAHVGRDGLCKGLLEENFALWPFLFLKTPKEGPSSLLWLLKAGGGCRGWAFEEIQPGERHWAGGASKGSVMLLRGRHRGVAPLC